jgi:UPF0716 protein FxsA
VRVAARLALVLLVAAAGEIVVLYLLARQIGPAWTLGLVIATSVLGAVLLRREGTRGWRRFRAALNERRPPGVEAYDGLVGLAAALLLFVPGLVSDLVGLVLLAPPVRGWAGRTLRRRTEQRISPAAANDLFGPRRVKRMDTADGSPTQPANGPATGELVEGEIIDPGR